MQHHSNINNQFSPSMSSLSSFETASPAVGKRSCGGDHQLMMIVDASQSTSYCSLINKRFVSVLIDKDEDYITKRNETFDLNDVNRFRDAVNSFSSNTAGAAVGANKSNNNKKPNVHKTSNRRKFYRWSKCKEGSFPYSRSPLKYASSLGLTVNKEPVSDTTEQLLA
jgi:hypothetical protein